jgi:hypothetical protein
VAQNIVEHSSRALQSESLDQLKPIVWWLRIIVLFGALLCTMGAVIAIIHPAMLVSPHDEINGAVHIYAGYLASRNLALAFMLVALLVMNAKRALGNLMVIVGLIQLIDTGMDLMEARWAVAPGVFVFGIVYLIAAAQLSSGQPFWKRAAWGN